MDLRTKLEGLLGRVRGLHPLLRPASILWALVFVVLALTLQGLASAGTLVIDGDSFALIELILVMGAALSLVREYLLRPLDRLADSEDVRKKLLGRAIPVVRDVAILAALVAATTLTLELPWNTSFSEVDPSFIGLDRLVVTIVVVCAYFVGQRRGAVLALAVAALDTLGIAQGFMLALKGTALLPSDLLALGTAAAVPSASRSEGSSAVPLSASMKPWAMPSVSSAATASASTAPRRCPTK